MGIQRMAPLPGQHRRRAHSKTCLRVGRIGPDQIFGDQKGASDDVAGGIGKASGSFMVAMRFMQGGDRQRIDPATAA
jgi:hypothetical protein